MANYMLRTMTALTLFALGMTFGCSAVGDGNVKPDKIPSPAVQFLIGPSDVLTISVWNHKELDRTVTVRPDGKLSLALVGDITAAGLGPLELQAVIEKALRNYMKVVPGDVTVVVDAVHSYKVSVMGEVRLPGRFEFQNQVSVLDALAQAGGLTEFASANKILIIRKYHGQEEKILFDYKSVVRSNILSAPVLFPGDIILVP